MKYVVITAVGDDRTGIVNELSEEILNDGGNIEDSRMAVLGGAFTIIMLVVGEPEAIEKLITQIPAMERKLGMTIVVKKTKPRRRDASLLPYRIDDEAPTARCISFALPHRCGFDGPSGDRP